MELILILLILAMQNKKDGKPALDLQKLAPLLNSLDLQKLAPLLGALGDESPLGNLLKNVNLDALLKGDLGSFFKGDLDSLSSDKSNLSDILNAVSAFSSFTQSAAPSPEKAQNCAMPPLQPISKIANANISYALNSYFSE